MGRKLGAVCVAVGSVPTCTIWFPLGRCVRRVCQYDEKTIIVAFCTQKEIILPGLIKVANTEDVWVHRGERMFMGLDLKPRGSVTIECIVNGPIGTNSYFMGSSGQWIVIDPAWDGAALVERFRAEHPGETLLGSVCTHGHADHMGGVAGVRSSLGKSALYALPAKDLETVTQNIEEQRLMWGIDTPDAGAPTRLLVEGDSLTIGDALLQVMEVPGHTPGGVVLFAATLQGNVAFVGDTLFPGGHGRTDLSGGDDEAILDSLVRMGRDLPPSTMCLIGHGPATTIEAELSDNPFMHQ